MGTTSGAVASTPPLKVRLALQGGGAKIVGLVAALDAIQSLNQEIQVTRVAGTSAGAIAGTLFAAGVPMGTVKAYLSKLRIQDVVPDVSNHVLFYRVFRGRPIWNDKPVSDVIMDLLTSAGYPIDTFDDIEDKTKVRVMVVATDLRDGQMVSYSRDKRVLSSLLDSSGVPFGFRAAKGQVAHIVDGGICENLPSELLSQDNDSSEPILAISFRPQARHIPTSPLEFAQSLLDTAIDNSVHRAKRSGDIIFHEIETTITTFDF
jgi:predicted acylesterase/phospholipase RssA